MSKEEEDNKVLSLTDACAGFVGAVYLYFVQKMPDTSDAKQLMLYATAVVAVVSNNILRAITSWGARKLKKIKLERQGAELRQQYDAYKKSDSPDPGIVQAYDEAMKNTQLAMLENSAVLTARSVESISENIKSEPSRNFQN